MSQTPDKFTFSEGDLFQNAFEHAAIGMALVGLDGSFLKVNRSLSELLGYTADSLLQMTFQDITYPEDLETDLSLLSRLVAGEIPDYRMEKRYYTKEGAIVWILLSVSMVRGADGAPRFFISQIQDITNRKEAEAVLRTTLREKEGLVSELQRSHSEILSLRSKLLTICAWTKRVRCNDRWMSVDEFLVNELGLNLTHGMSAEAEESFMLGVYSQIGREDKVIPPGGAAPAEA